jgi:large subunit ribosomal protein L25
MNVIKNHKLKVFIRNKKENLKEIKNNGMIPAISYNKNKTTLLKVNKKDILKIINEGKIYPSIQIFYFNNLKKKVYKIVTIKEIQKNNFMNQIIHIDFYEINPNKVTKFKIPLRIIGRNLRNQSQEKIIDFHNRFLIVKCLFKNVPKHIEVDVSDLKVGHSIFLKDILKIKSFQFVNFNKNLKIVSSYKTKASISKESEEQNIVDKK